MGLDIGAIHIDFLPRPQGIVREFAWHLLTDATDDSPLMCGEGQRWSLITRRHMAAIRDALAEAKPLNLAEIAMIDIWVESLPWEENHGVLMPENDEGADESPVVELYFNC